MDEKNENRELRRYIANRFHGKTTLESRYLPQIPASAEREYLRLANDYMKMVKDSITPELCALKKCYKVERDDKQRMDGESDLLMKLTLLFNNAQNRMLQKQSGYGLRKKLENMGQLTRKLTVKEFRKSVKATLGIDIREDYYSGDFYRKGLEKWTEENVNLIKTMPNDCLAKMKEKVLADFTKGKTSTDMMKDLQRIYKVDRNHARMIARDQTAKLNGRIQRAQQQDAGIDYYIWSGVPDGRERLSHVELNGRVFSWNEPPTNSDGRTCHPGEDFQCRCVGRPVFDINTITLPVDTSSLPEVPPAAEPDGLQLAQPVNGKDISQTWTRRENQFDYEIEDVINAQGFDGVPSVVSPEEFDEYVKESKFIAQRTYSAPTEEVLNEYQEQLYKGKWYVDCGEGGAQYGQGMYCAADYEGKITDGIKAEMAHYKELGNDRLGEAIPADVRLKKHLELLKDAGVNVTEDGKAYLQAMYDKDTSLAREIAERMTRQEKRALLSVETQRAFEVPSITETFTLRKDAKIAKYDDLVTQRQRDGVIDKDIARAKWLKENVLLNKQMTDQEKSIFVYRLVGNTDNGGGIMSEQSFKKYMGIFDKLDESFDSWKDMKNHMKDVYLKYGYSSTGHRVDDAINQIVKDAEKITKMDIGSYAVLKGYDAINAVGHGESGSYTVILNRTKVIFRKG